MKKLLLCLLMVFASVELVGCSKDENYITGMTVYQWNKKSNEIKQELNENQELLVAVVDLSNTSDKNWEDRFFWSDGVELTLNQNEYETPDKYDYKLLSEFIENSGYSDVYTLNEIYAQDTKKIILPFIVNRVDTGSGVNGTVYVNFDDNYSKMEFNYDDVKMFDLYDEILIDQSGEAYQMVKSLNKRMDYYMGIMKSAQLAYQNISIENALGYVPNGGKDGKTMLKEVKGLWDLTRKNGNSITGDGTNNFHASEKLPEINIDSIILQDEEIGKTIKVFEENMDKILSQDNNASSLYEKNKQIIMNFGK